MRNGVRLLLIFAIAMQAGCAMLISIPKPNTISPNSAEAISVERDFSKAKPAQSKEPKSSLKPAIQRAPVILAPALELEEKSAKSQARRQRDLTFAKAQKEATARLEQRKQQVAAELRTREILAVETHPLASNQSELHPIAIERGNSTKVIDSRDATTQVAVHDNSTVEYTDAAVGSPWFSAVRPSFTLITTVVLVLSGMSWPLTRLQRRQSFEAIAASKTLASLIKSQSAARDSDISCLDTIQSNPKTSNLDAVDSEVSNSETVSSAPVSSDSVNTEPVLMSVDASSCSTVLPPISDFYGTVSVTLWNEADCNSGTTFDAYMVDLAPALSVVQRSDSPSLEVTKRRVASCVELIPANVVRVQAKGPVNLLPRLAFAEANQLCLIAKPLEDCPRSMLAVSQNQLSVRLSRHLSNEVFNGTLGECQSTVKYPVSVSAGRQIGSPREIVGILVLLAEGEDPSTVDFSQGKRVMIVESYQFNGQSELTAKVLQIA